LLYSYRSVFDKIIWFNEVLILALAKTWVSKISKFFAGLKMGQFTFVACSYQKIEPKNSYRKKSLKTRFFAQTFDRSKLQK
jgi:hypothetical protein